MGFGGTCFLIVTVPGVQYGLPLLVCEHLSVRLQPGSDVSVVWKAVVGTESLKLSNLRENLKLLQWETIKHT